MTTRATLVNLASSVEAYRTARGSTCRIVALNPAPQRPAALPAKLLGKATQITQAHLPGDRVAATSAPFPVALALLAVVIALALAANELFSARLTWSPDT